MQTIIVDANVIIKTFIDEPDSQIALDFLEACVTNYASLKAPHLLQYEIAQIVSRKGIDIGVCRDFLEDTVEKVVEQSTPRREAWQVAEKIVKTGHQKSGYPSMYDSIYHAMAIVADGTFVTADHHRYEKAENYGHIVLLKNWDAVFREETI